MCFLRCLRARRANLYSRSYAQTGYSRSRVAPSGSYRPEGRVWLARRRRPRSHPPHPRVRLHFLLLRLPRGSLSPLPTKDSQELNVCLCVCVYVRAAAQCRPSATSDGPSSRACVRTRPAQNSGPSAPRRACLRSANGERSSRRRTASPPSKRFRLLALCFFEPLPLYDFRNRSAELFLGCPSVQVIRSGQKFSSTYVHRLVPCPESLRHLTDLVSPDLTPAQRSVSAVPVDDCVVVASVQSCLFAPVNPATRARSRSAAVNVGRLRAFHPFSSLRFFRRTQASNAHRGKKRM